jgi:hypothetical protein
LIQEEWSARRDPLVCIDPTVGLFIKDGPSVKKCADADIEWLLKRVVARGSVMNDINALVQRLRACELPGDRQYEREARIVLSSLLTEAADAIERLIVERDEAQAARCGSNGSPRNLPHD